MALAGPPSISTLAAPATTPASRPSPAPVSNPTETSSSADAIESDPYVIWIDADFSIAAPAAHAIDAGVRTALHRAGGRLAGHPVEVIRLDHHGNSRRSLRNLQRASADPRTVAIVGGLHSPPLLAHRDFINRESLLLLDPWAAAAPITRPETDENWIFRLSVDDANAGPFLVGAALDRYGDDVVLLAEQTGWGETNAELMSAAYLAATGRSLEVFPFNWDIGKLEAGELVRTMLRSKPRAVLYVGNVTDASVLFPAIAAIPSERRPAICSHWGITSGRFGDVVSKETVDQLDLTFLQTRWSYTPEDPSCRFHQAWSIARADIVPDAGPHPQELGPPTGFVHAHDITALLVAAANQAALDGGLTGIGRSDRVAIRAALERLDQPVSGILRVFDRPFSPWVATANHSDAAGQHEALSLADYALGTFDEHGRVVIDPVDLVTDHRPAGARAHVPGRNEP